METAKILVVEDDADINGLLTAILKKQGYEVTSAFSGSEAGLCLQNGTIPAGAVGSDAAGDHGRNIDRADPKRIHHADSCHIRQRAGG